MAVYWKSWRIIIGVLRYIISIHFLFELRYFSICLSNWFIQWRHEYVLPLSMDVIFTPPWVNAFLPLSPNRARGVLSSPAGRAGGRYLTPLPLSRAQFLSDRGQTWWGRILGQDLGRVRSWETLISDFDLPSPLPLSRVQFLSDRGQTWWGRILGQDLGQVRSWETWLVN